MEYLLEVQWLDPVARAVARINVHVPYEGEIPGTDLLIPLDKVEGAARFGRRLG